MDGWRWLPSDRSWRGAARLAVKVALIAAALNLIYALIQPMNWLEGVSVYNHLVPGRLRFSFQDQNTIYATTVVRLTQMFAQHEISGSPRVPNQTRIAFLGGSSIWGYGLSPHDTFAACLQRDFQAPDGRSIRSFNLAYPAPSMLRDLITLRRALQYDLDTVVWFVGGIGILRPRMFVAPMLAYNPEEVRSLMDELNINPPEKAQPPADPNFWARTLIGDRARIVTWTRDQLWGLDWLQRGEDGIPFGPSVRYRDPDPDSEGEGVIFDPNFPLNPGEVSDVDFMFDLVAAGHQMAAAAGVRVILFIDPMWYAPEGTATLRYNEYFPRWYFDQFQQSFERTAAQNGWELHDWSQALPNESFTDSVFHYTPEAACELARQFVPLLQNREGE